MELQGQVLQRFRDTKDKNKLYAPEDEKDIDKYTGEEITYPHIFRADKVRYESLEAKGYVGKGSIVNQKKFYKIEEE